jgi:hypothetical protein
MAHTTDELTLTRKDRMALEALAANGNTAQKIASDGRWLVGQRCHARDRCQQELGMALAKEVPRSRRRRAPQRQDEEARQGPLSEAVRARVVKMAATARPPQATHWSVRMLAKANGVSPRSVERILAEHGLKPHLTRSFKVSNDPNFAAKVKDIVGLYLNPPENAIVLSVDEKSQIQALDRT